MKKTFYDSTKHEYNIDTRDRNLKHYIISEIDMTKGKSIEIIIPLLLTRIWLPIILSLVIYFVFDVNFVPTFIVCLVLNIVNNIRLRKKNR